MSAELQDMIDQASPGAVLSPTGQFPVDAVNAPIRLKSDLTLDLSAATLIALPNNKTNSNLLKVSAANNVRVVKGIIQGERDTHIWTADQFPDGKLPANPADYWKSGGWGHGIRVDQGSRNVSIEGTHVNSCFGDGVYIEDAYNVSVRGAVLDRNRRDGVAVIDVDGLTISSCQLSNTGGTPNGDGIILECDYARQKMKNIIIEKNLFFGNAGSDIGVNMSPGQYNNIRIMGDNRFDLKRQPIWLGSGGNLGTPAWAFLLNRSLSWWSGYRWWGYPTSWYLP